MQFKKVFTNRVFSHSWSCEFALFECFFTGTRSACMWQPPRQPEPVNERQQLSRRTLSATLPAPVCVCVCVCRRVIQEELQPEQSLSGRSSLASSLLSSLTPPLASFQIPSLPCRLSFFLPASSTSSPLWISRSGQQLCRDSPAATAREGESRKRKRRGRQINRLL